MLVFMRNSIMIIIITAETVYTCCQSTVRLMHTSLNSEQTYQTFQSCGASEKFSLEMFSSFRLTLLMGGGHSQRQAVDVLLEIALLTNGTGNRNKNWKCRCTMDHSTIMPIWRTHLERQHEKPRFDPVTEWRRNMSGAFHGIADNA